MLALAAVLGALAVLPWFAAVLVAVAASSWLAFAHQALAQVVMQRAPEEMKGRVSGLWFAVGSGGKALSAPLAGVLADTMGPPVGMVACAALLTAAALAVTAYARRERLRARR